MPKAYLNLLGQTVVGGVIMYFVMFTMIDSLSDFFNNLNMAYMAVMMVAPMTVLMLLAMPHMFPSKAINLGVMVGALILFVAAFTAMRAQGGVGDRQFVRSMIPHHSGAILMCEKSAIRDPRLVALCTEIIRAQKEEITRMKEIYDTPMR